MTATYYDGLLAQENVLFRYYDGATYTTRLRDPKIVQTSVAVSSVISGRTITFYAPHTKMVEDMGYGGVTYPTNAQDDINISIWGRP